MENSINRQLAIIEGMIAFINCARKWNTPTDMAYLEQRLAEAQEVLDQLFWTACQG